MTDRCHALTEVADALAAIAVEAKGLVMLLELSHPTAAMRAEAIVSLTRDARAHLTTASKRQP